MIPAIGLMVGAYIFTRMVEAAQTSTSKAVRLLAALTCVLTVFCVLSLLASSSRIPNM